MLNNASKQKQGINSKRPRLNKGRLNFKLQKFYALLHGKTEYLASPHIEY